MTIFTPRPQWIVDLINELAGTGGGTWGAISGTLSNQTDLQTALDAKVNGSQISAFGGTLIDDADAAAARTTLGLGSAATLSTSDIDERARDAVGTALVAGSNITITQDDGANTITIAAAGGVASGTSFPGSPSTNDRFFRTDRGIEYFYDGTRWLSVSPLLCSLPLQGTSGVTATTLLSRCPNPGFGICDILITSVVYAITISGTGTWTISLNQADGGSFSLLDSSTFVGPGSTNRLADNNAVSITVASTVEELYSNANEDSGTATAFPSVSFQYRLIG